MKKVLFGCIAAAAAFGASGCYVGLPDWERSGPGELRDDRPPRFLDDDPYLSGSLDNVRGGVMNGQLNGTQAFDEPVYEVEGGGWDGYTDLTFHAGQNRWLMVGVSIEGELDLLEPGMRVESTTDEHGIAESTAALAVSAYGCEGPSQYDADMDLPASKVALEAFEGANPTERTLELTAYFNPADFYYDRESEVEELHTSFTYTLPE